ncbi:hypothetical protein COBT_004210, partial [Conglomerata obtusa]
MGCIERVNQSFLCKLKALYDYKISNWEKQVNAATYAVNISYNRAIGTSPICYKFGMTPIFDIDKKHNIKSLKISKLKLIENRDNNFKKYSTKHILKGKRNCFNDYK